MTAHWPTRRDHVFGCELWTGRRDRDGYGRHKSELAHRAVWIAANGPIPDGREVEHICRRRHCVRLAHLTLLTRSEQESAKSWRRRAKRECPNGCDMSVTAMTTPEGGRLCRRCER